MRRHWWIGLFAIAGLAVVTVRAGTGLSQPAGAPANMAPAQDAAPPHPLDPLSPEELRTAIDVLRTEGRVTETMRFPVVTLKEPNKADVLAHRPGDAMTRQAFVSAFDRATNETHEAIIGLAAKKTVSWKAIPGVQPPVLVEEYEAAARIVREDARWQAAMKRRGVEDLPKVQLDAWAGGALVLPGHEGARLLRVLSYLRVGSGVAYTRPIEGVVATVNMTTRKVVDFMERPPVPVSDDAPDIFDAATLGPPRPGLKPLRVLQPDGVSFSVAGNEVRWQNWRFRFAMHPREGLVLSAIGYDDGGTLRPILYRASLSEMLVPYGDPGAAWHWRNAFDQGEYGLGQFANTLRRGEEVPENAMLFSATHADELGQLVVRKDVIALYEQDAGILWRHLDYESLRTVNRRGRQLVVHYLFTVGNYDYGLQWIFHQEGAIEARVELSGMLLARGVADARCAACRQKPDAQGQIVSDGDDRYGTVVAKNIVAPNHQHFFCFRLDLDVDGPENSVAELDMISEPDPEKNPHGTAFLVRQQRLRTEQEGRRSVNGASNRCWKVFHPSAAGELGHFPSYLLEPGPTPPPFAAADAAVRRRGRFIEHPVWLTRFQPDELYAAGPYPNQNLKSDGLPVWSDSDESLEKTDLVLWHVLGVSHMPRVEEWPVMPVARAGFKLVPHGFFRRNPALDVPEAAR